MEALSIRSAQRGYFERCRVKTIFSLLDERTYDEKNQLWSEFVTSTAMGFLGVLCRDFKLMMLVYCTAIFQLSTLLS